MRITDTHVYFWGGVLSNFYTCEISYAGHRFHSSEQLFMWMKASLFNDEEAKEEILDAPNPAQAKKIGRQVKGFDDAKWEAYRCHFMTCALVEKFKQNPGLKNFLFKYRDKIFVEASPYDKIWGVGLIKEDDRILDESKWEGQNLLGICLKRAVKDLNFEDIDPESVNIDSIEDVYGVCLDVPEL